MYNINKKSGPKNLYHMSKKMEIIKKKLLDIKGNVYFMEDKCSKFYLPILLLLKILKISKRKKDSYVDSTFLEGSSVDKLIKN
jgi:hypothetical protein